MLRERQIPQGGCFLDRPESTPSIAEPGDYSTRDASIGGCGEPIEKSATNNRVHAARAAGFVR